VSFLLDDWFHEWMSDLLPEIGEAYAREMQVIGIHPGQVFQLPELLYEWQEMFDRIIEALN
jgi:hypothetical protein